LNAIASQKNVNILRDGDWKNISVYDVLVGDIQEVSTGEILSVDGVLIEGFNLIADESAMTG
jgi:Ca2+-transporting ATPase